MSTPYYDFMLDPKSKQDKVKVTNLKNLTKFWTFELWKILYTRHTFWSCLIRCVNMKLIWQVLWKIQSRHDSVHRWTHGRMDRWTRWNQYTPPSTALSMGYKNCSILIEITCIWYINTIILFTLFSPPKWYFSWTKYPCTHLFHRCSDDPFQFVNQILQKRQCLVITMVADHQVWALYTHIAKFMWPTWGPPGSCRHQMSPKLAPWTSVTWIINITGSLDLFVAWEGPADHPKML